MNFDGKVIKYGDNVDTDVIIPARYLNTIDKKELASHCMEDLDPTFVSRVVPGDIMVAGYNFGAGNRHRVKQAFWVTTALGSAVCILAALFLFPFSEQAIMLFRDDDMEVVRIGSEALRFMCIILPTMAYSTYVNQLYQCLGFSTIASLLASCRQGIFFIPLVLILPRVIGIAGIEIVQPAADLLTAIISVYFHIRFFKRELNE